VQQPNKCRLPRLHPRESFRRALYWRHQSSRAPSRPAQTKEHSRIHEKVNVVRLVYFEPFGDMRNAISREKQIKRWRREKKLIIIRAMNPQFRDLSEDFPK
jgi:predicted GIY-YIG superfamily endonuclease